MPTRNLALTLAAVVLASGTAFAFPPGGGNSIQQIVQQANRLQQQQQQQQQKYREAIQKRNQEYIKKYQEEMKKRQEQWTAYMKELKEQGVTPEQFLEMQRQQFLATIPKHKHSAYRRQWAKQDRIRKRELEKAQRTANAGKGDEGGDDLGLEGLKLE